MTALDGVEEQDHRGRMSSVRALIDRFNADLERGEVLDLVPVPTGFTPLDRVLGGGLHAGALTVIGGAPGVGKTILGLQWARHIALSGRDVIYVCYEHEEVELLVRLLTMELEGLDDEVADRVRDAVVTSAASAGQGLREILQTVHVSEQILATMDRYAQHLHLVRASGAHTDVARIDALVDGVDDPAPVVMVDYLQKVRLDAEVPNEAEKITRVTEGLKDLALTRGVPVVSLVAVEMEGLRDQRIRMHHFRGSSALVFEADVALVLNDKQRAVSKAHLAYDPLRAASFRDWVVMSVEKNRGGANQIDLEFRKDFGRFRFEPEGRMVEERLRDDVHDEL